MGASHSLACRFCYNQELEMGKDLPGLCFIDQYITPRVLVLDPATTQHGSNSYSCHSYHPLLAKA